MKNFQTIGVTCAAAFIAVTALAQEKRPVTSGEAEAGTFSWGNSLTYVSNHFVKAAEDFPEDKYTYRPTDDVRTFGEIILHVARYNELVAADELGREPEDVSAFAFHSKKEAVAKIKQSFKDLDEVRKKKPASPNVADSLIHTSEHYGNLVVYYRLNGLVPPASR